MTETPPITPVLLCGGSGTRLWPLSRKSYPKQFAPFLGEDSLFQQAAKRVSGPGFAAPMAITGDGFRFIVTEQLAHCGITPSSVLIEPDGRNTAPAAAAAALYLAQTNPDSLMLLVSADHAIPDIADFQHSVMQGAQAALEGQIITFGIIPTRAETGYGWLEAGAETSSGVYQLEQFIEKPDQTKADHLFSDARYLWNAGLFLARADVLIAAFEAHAPDILTNTKAAINAATPDLGFLRIDSSCWQTVRAESIDYAVMEHAKNISLVRFTGRWSDLGSWESVWQESPKDPNGNAAAGFATAINCTDTLLRSESPEIEL